LILLTDLLSRSSSSRARSCQRCQKTKKPCSLAEPVRMRSVKKGAMAEPAERAEKVGEERESEWVSVRREIAGALDALVGVGKRIRGELRRMNELLTMLAYRDGESELEMSEASEGVPEELEGEVEALEEEEGEELKRKCAEELEEAERSGAEDEDQEPANKKTRTD